MLKRVITGAIMFLVFAPFIVLGGLASTILFAVLAYIGTFELLRMYRSKNAIPKACLYIIPIFSSLMVLSVGCNGIDMSGIKNCLEDIMYTLILSIVTLLFIAILGKGIAMKDIVFFIFALIYSGFSFAIMAGLRNSDLIDTMSCMLSSIRPCLGYYDLFGVIEINWVGLVLFGYVLLTTMFTDIGAYQFGVLFGKKKLCPNISPKKTVEGSIAGTICGALIGTSFIVIIKLFVSGFSYTNFPQFDNIYLFSLVMFCISLLLSVAGQIGDLVASKLKREYEIKDFGQIFPGHGGVLDRFDSTILTTLLFTAILFLLGAF
ncbi:MAG: phosphatidate cytidylyltransferase [Prevotella sp.]|nr:phosphatidate cytidylyltransferase [Staphylococcus sp.]MCM1350416.1 phosphatidate cytidylyltransferase [Prevotella sp.]